MATLNPALIDFWFDGPPSEATFRKARHRVLYGGRSSSKSWEFSGMAASIASQYKTRFLCVRRYQNKIKESVYTLIKKQIDNFGHTGFDVLATEIRHANGSEFAFYGIDRNTDEIKSFEGADILWIEEAHNLTKEQWDILEPTIRKEGSEIWISFNPKNVTDFVWQKFIVNPPPDTIVRLINYTENQFLSETMRKTIEAKKEEDYESYEHIYLGVPLKDDHRVIIKRSWVEAAVKADLGEVPAMRMAGMDVSDSGEDMNALVIRSGPYVAHVEEWNSETTTLATRYAFMVCQQFDCTHMAFDAIGVGAGVKGEARDLVAKGHDFVSYPINVSNSPTDKKYDEGRTGKELFRDLKMELWWIVRERFRKTYEHFNGIRHHNAEELISIPDDEQLITELCTPYLIINETTGKMNVESKKDLRERGVKSPNKADALILSFAENPTISRKLDGLFDSKM